MPLEEAAPAHRIRYLDGLRGLAIAMVVLFHTFHRVAPASLISRYGLMGVELFFMISGFVILMTLEKCSTFHEFLKRRWMRLWPAMFIACFVTLAWWIHFPAPPNVSVWPGLTLIDDRWYSSAFDRNIKSLDGAYWTLYLEMRFYVIFGLAYFLFGRWKAIALLIAMSLVYLALLSAGEGMGVFRYTDLHFEAWFAAGALFYAWTKERKPGLFYAAIAAGSLAAWIYYPSLGPRLFGLMLVALFALSVRSAAAQSVLSWRGLTWLGAISYPLYLIHEPMIDAAHLAGVAVALAIAHVIARYAEPWLRAQIKNGLAVRSGKLAELS